MRTRPTFILLLAACGLMASCGNGKADKATRPNILLVTLDTQRSDVLGCYGQTRNVTPNLDRLAAEGTRFTRAYTVTPLTIPAHSSVFTGLYPPRHGVRDNGDYFLDEGAVTLAERLRDEGYATMASVGAEVTSHHWGFGQGFDAFHDDMGLPDPKTKNRWRVERRGDEVIADASGWLTEHAAEKPWFSWVHLFDPHAPYEAPEPWASEHPGRRYMAEVAYTDSLVGQLVDQLETQGQLDNTWIFVVGDHGEGLGSHGESMHGVLLYDATTHIPFIIKPPIKTTQPGTLDAPVSLVDLTPSILAAAGLPVPDGLDGQNLLPWLSDPQVVESQRDRRIYVESLYAYRHYGWAQQRALVGPQYKYIDSTTPELYLRSNHDESDNLAQAEAQLLAEMKRELDERVAAMELEEGAAGPARLSAERQAQLEALGYVTAIADDTLPTEGLPDPVERLPILADLELARMAFQGDNPDKAEPLVRAVIDKEPTLHEAKILLAMVLWRQGRLEDAYEVVKAVDAERPASGQKAVMGNLLLHMDRTEEALPLLQAALEVDPYLASAWVPYLHALLLSGDMETLKTQTGKALEALPGNAEALGMEGVALAMEGNFEEAELSLQEALERNPDQPFAHHAMGVLQLSRNQDIEAESMFLEEVKRFPGAMVTRRMLVEMYARQNRYEEQLEQLELIASAEMPNVLTMHSRAQCLFNLKQFDEALESVTACTGAAPSYPACAMLEANVLKKLGRDEEAEAAFQRAVELAGGRATGKRL